MSCNQRDALIVARALVDDCVEWDNGYENAMNSHDGWVCNQCYGGVKPETQKIEDFKHSLYCPVLVAMDMLT